MLAKSFMFVGITVLILNTLTISKPLDQEKSTPVYPLPNLNVSEQSAINQKLLTHRLRNLQTDTQQLSQSSNNEDQVMHFQADEFQFSSHLSFPSSTRLEPDQYAESLTQSEPGSFDVILIQQGDTTTYFFKVSSQSQPCQSNGTRACQQTVQPARGNIADLQISLQTTDLKPGTYAFGSNESTLVTEVAIYSRQLYSDPSHGMVGCQRWGAGAFQVEKVIYDPEGKLKFLEASLFRSCDRPVPFPTPSSQDSQLQLDNQQQATTETIENYVYHAAWRCHLNNFGETSR